MKRAIFNKDTGKIIKILTGDSESMHSNLQPNWDISVDEPLGDDINCIVDINTKKCRRMTNDELKQHQVEQDQIRDQVVKKDQENARKLQKRINQEVNNGNIEKVIYKLMRNESFDD